MSAQQWGFILVASAGAIWLAGRSRTSDPSDLDPSDPNWVWTSTGGGLSSISYREETIVGVDWEGVTYLVQRKIDHYVDGTTFESGMYRAVRTAGAGGMVDNDFVSSGNAGFMTLSNTSPLKAWEYDAAFVTATEALAASGTSPPDDPAGVLVGGSDSLYTAYGDITLVGGRIDVGVDPYNDPFSGNYLVAGV